MASEDEVKVLSFWVSPYAMRVLIALEEKGIKYEHVEEENLLSAKSALLLEMNPVYKKVPVLIHNGKPVAESLVILQYIEETWTSGPVFLPADPYDRAISRFWADFVHGKLSDAGRRILLTKGEEQEAGKQEFIENLVILEETLKGKDYFGGDVFGFVDIVLVSLICWFHTFEILGGFKIPFENKCPGIAAWVKKCMERESVRKILPEPEKVLQYGKVIRSVMGKA